MSFSDIFIRRPVLATVVALMIILLGLQGIAQLTVREYPKVDETVITVTTNYAGASADLIQGFITAPIAEAVATTENIDYVTSSSRPSSSTVTVQMKLGANPDAALTEVIAKVNQVRGDLPDESDDPVIVKGTGQNFATMYLAAQNPNMTSEQITEYLERVIQPRMSTIQGVAKAEILGGQVYSMRVWLDPIQLAARQITAPEVLAAINASNFLSAPGTTKNEYVSSSITLKSTLQTPEAFGAMPIKASGDDVVRLRDVARVELAAKSTDTIVSFNGSAGTFLGVFPTPAANPIDMAAAVRKELPSIQASLPEGMSLVLVYDATEQISSSIKEVFTTIGEAVAIVILVIIVFLGSFRSVLIPIVTIPISLIGVCFFLYALGFSINLLSLLAMVLAIGLVVDDAIVVVENVERNIGLGLAIPSNLARDVVDQLVKHGEVVRGTLGIESQNLTPQLAQSLGLSETRGALVTRVLAGSGAAAAGLKPGDVVVSANGQRVDSAQALHNIEGLQAVGTTLTLDIRRDGKAQQLKASLKEQPRAVSGESLDPRLTGATFADLPESMRQAGLSGVLVNEVKRGSRAANSGLASGDIVIQASAGEFADLASWRANFQQRPQQLVLRIVRGGASGQLVMR